ncbi:MAG: hypothetical protein WCO56_03350 [Verrucomicrobiota bacterium]
MLAISWWPLTSNAQAFMNLDFEAATIIPIVNDPYQVEWDAAMPGWSGYYGNTYTGIKKRTSLVYNTLSIGDPSIDLLGPGSGYQMSGNYCLALQTSVTFYFTDVYITQTGTIPADANSIQFKGSSARNGFIVSLDGHPISMPALKTDGSYYQYGGDISAFAGQTVELRITDIAVPNSESMFFIDSIAFSTEAVPEPGVITLCCAGGMMVWWLLGRRRRTEKQQNVG